jgi:hypothetical protein
MAIWRGFVVKRCMGENDVNGNRNVFTVSSSKKRALSSRVDTIHNNVIPLTFLLRKCFDEVRDRFPLQHGKEMELPTRKALNNANEIFMMKVCIFLWVKETIIGVKKR